MGIVSLLCKVDDFFFEYQAYQASRSLEAEKSPETRRRPRHLHPSEGMTLLIAFHQSGYRTLKHFYEKHVCLYWSAEFPNRVRYSRFVQLKQNATKHSPILWLRCVETDFIRELPFLFPTLAWLP